MTKSRIGVAGIALALTLLPGPANALDDELRVGEAIFQQLCASCHGAGGNGDGEIAELFKMKPRALSQLSKENGGEFPFELVYQTLKATEKIKGHGGSSAMPVWGDYFGAEKVLNDPDIEETESFIALGKMLSVIYYIETLQEK